MSRLRRRILTALASELTVALMELRIFDLCLRYKSMAQI
jgi:hypothetical protein